MKPSISTLLIVILSSALLLVVALDISGLGILPTLPESVRILNLSSILLVLGGVMLATAISHPPDVMRRGFPFLFRLMYHPDYNDSTMIVTVSGILDWQRAMRENRLKTRAQLAEKLDRTFEGYLFGLISTNYSSEEIRRLGESKLRYRSEQMLRSADMFGDMSRTAPAFGMLGTLIGLIQMLGSFDSISELGRGLSFALMTTLYGIVMANTIFGPLESKIRNVASATEARDRLMLDGILMIHDNVQPLLVFDTLMAKQSGLAVEAMPGSMPGGPVE